MLNYLTVLSLNKKRLREVQGLEDMWPKPLQYELSLCYMLMTVIRDSLGLLQSTHQANQKRVTQESVRARGGSVAFQFIFIDVFIAKWRNPIFLENFLSCSQDVTSIKIPIHFKILEQFMHSAFT